MNLSIDPESAFVCLSDIAQYIPHLTDGSCVRFSLSSLLVGPLLSMMMLLLLREYHSYHYCYYHVYDWH